jgi:hypothetical protein
LYTQSHVPRYYFIIQCLLIWAYKSQCHVITSFNAR